MKSVIVKFKNLTPLHIGTGRENYDFSAGVLQSDTISSALASLYAAQGGDCDVYEFLNSFVITSAFPYSDNHYFLPAPNGKLDIMVNGEDEQDYRKNLKKIRYIDSEIWKSLTNGQSVEIERKQLNGTFLIADDYNGFKVPYVSQVNERVAVSRDGSDNTSPFFFDWTYFCENSGLYCILSCDDNKLPLFESLFSSLGETGIGTDRNIGGGKFDVEFVDMDILPAVKDANASMLLSMYIPTAEELAGIDLENSRYDLQLRGGYISGSGHERFRHLRKKSVYMFSAGSVFASTQSLSGKIVDLRPDWNDDALHPVYRSGKPFVVPIKIKKL